MTKSSLSPAEAARRSERRAVMEQERARLAQQRVADERERVASTAAKTARLRRLREARDEAERELEAMSADKATAGGRRRTRAGPLGSKTRSPP